MPKEHFGDFSEEAPSGAAENQNELKERGIADITEISSKGVVIEKQSQKGSWGMVPVAHSFKDNFKILVRMPDGYEKWISVTGEDGKYIKEGDLITVTLKPWEQKEYIAKLRRIIESATSTDDLIAKLRPLGGVSAPDMIYRVDLIAETLENLKRYGKETSFDFMPDVAGFKEVVRKLVAKEISTKNKR